MQSVRFFALALLLAPALVLGWASAGARAEGLPIEAFFGKWQGSGISQSEVSANFRLTARDLDVTLAPQPPGFNVAWTTVQRQKGSPDDPKVVRKTTRFEFLPGPRPGLWRELSNEDPMAGLSYAWARIKDNTLTIHSLLVLADGGSELQIYQRSLSGSGMTLNFRRLVDGILVRSVKGRLVKVGK